MSEAAADALGFVYEPMRGPKRRAEFETQPDGSHLRIESEWTGCAWREIGRERCLSMRRV